MLAATLVLAAWSMGTQIVHAQVGYSVNRERSYLLVITGKSGLFGFAAHDHAALATDWSFEAAMDGSGFKGSSLTIKVPVSSLVIDSPESRRLAGLGPGPNASDVREIQKKMLGPDVLDGEQYPTIVFSTTSVAVTGPGELRVTGQFRMHGRDRQITVPVHYSQRSENGWDFSGEFPLKQTDFGIQPVSLGLGTVKVKDEVRIRFTVSVFRTP